MSEWEKARFLGPFSLDKKVSKRFVDLQYWFSNMNDLSTAHAISTNRIVNRPVLAVGPPPATIGRT